MRRHEYVVINNLFMLLREFKADEVIGRHYREKYGNTAPGEIMADQMRRLEQLLNEGVTDAAATKEV